MSQLVKTGYGFGVGKLVLRWMLIARKIVRLIMTIECGHILRQIKRRWCGTYNRFWCLHYQICARKNWLLISAVALKVGFCTNKWQMMYPLGDYHLRLSMCLYTSSDELAKFYAELQSKFAVVYVRCKIAGYLAEKHCGILLWGRPSSRRYFQEGCKCSSQKVWEFREC